MSPIVIPVFTPGGPFGFDSFPGYTGAPVSSISGNARLIRLSATPIGSVLVTAAIIVASAIVAPGPVVTSAIVVTNSGPTIGPRSIAFVSLAKVGLRILTIGEEGLDLAVDTTTNWADSLKIFLREHLLLENLVEGPIHDTRERDGLALLVIKLRFPFRCLGLDIFEEVIMQSAVGNPQTIKRIGDLNTVVALGTSHIAFVRTGAKVIMMVLGDVKVEPHGKSVRDFKALHHAVEGTISVLENVLVDVVTVTGLHGHVVDAWVDDICRNDTENLSGMSTCFS
ncbi:hypothetical protein HG530_014130 [Fusarium avenaceum]|nr:hypothetical protein HG530_014130 [Fusarium avenaceum]